MKIVTWNINRFNGNSSYNIWIDAKKRYAEKIREYIINKQIEDDDLVFLHEFPYGNNDTFKSFMTIFDTEEYEVLSWYLKCGPIEEEIAKNPIFVTVAIIKKKNSIWKTSEFNSCMNFEKSKNGKYNYVNRYIQIEKQNDISVMGLHWPAKNKKKKYNGVKDLNEALEKTTNIPNIILGDFNAGDYDKFNATDDFTDNRDEYKKLLEKYTDVCNGDRTTNYFTPTAIDHVLVEEKFLKQYKIDPYIDHEVELSDHYPIVVTLNKKV